MLLKLGTITAKFHQGPHALINLCLKISAGERAGEGGGGVINNSRDCRRGQRALFCSAPGAPYEHPSTQLLQEQANWIIPQSLNECNLLYCR